MKISFEEATKTILRLQPIKDEVVQRIIAETKDDMAATLSMGTFIVSELIMHCGRKLGPDARLEMAKSHSALIFMAVTLFNKMGTHETPEH